MAENNKKQGVSLAPTRVPTRAVSKKEPAKSGRFAVYIKRFFAQFGTALIAVAIVAYVFLQLMLNVGTMVETETATYAKISQKSELTAYLFRDEHVIPTGESGTDCFLANDGEKVKKGQDIAVTYLNSSDAEKQQRINEIDARMDVLRKSSLSDGASTTNISILDADIDSVMLDIIRDVDDNALDKALREKDKLLILLNRRSALVHSVSYAAEMSTLADERQRLLNSITGGSYVTQAPESGYFYSTVDGYENIFTVDALNSLTGEKFEHLSDSLPDESLSASSSGKIVAGSTWYIAVELDKRTAENFRNGGVYPVTFQYSNNIELKMTVERRITRTDKDVTVLVMSTKLMPDGFDYSRCQTVELTKTEYTGLRISTAALRMRDGETGVYVVQGSRVAFKTVEVLYTYGGYCICAIPQDPNYPNASNIAYNSKTRLSLHDTVITDGNGIYDGMRLT